MQAVKIKIWCNSCEEESTAKVCNPNQDDGQGGEDYLGCSHCSSDDILEEEGGDPVTLESYEGML